MSNPVKKPHAQKKHPKPATVRAKVKVGSASLPKKLDISNGYLLAQAGNDPQNKLGTEATALIEARAALMLVLKKEGEIKVEKDANEAAYVIAVANHDAATMDYATAAAKLSAGDKSMLTTLGVTAAAPPTKATNAAAGGTTLTVSRGPNAGDVVFKCRKVAGAGAYIVEYKLEPSLPTDAWLPPGGIITKYVSATVSGLAPEQQVRGRIRGVGGTLGPWSTEVVARAR